MYVSASPPPLPARPAACAAVDSVIDDERRTSVAGLTMSLNMLIETGPENAFDVSRRQLHCTATRGAAPA